MAGADTLGPTPTPAGGPGAEPGAARPPVPGKPVGFWREQIARADRVRAALEPWWDANLKAYAPRATDHPTTYGSEINTNRDFTLVERKKADLFYQSPEVSFVPSPWMDSPILGPDGQPWVSPYAPPPTPVPGQPPPPPPTTAQTTALLVHEELVNEALAADQVHATRMVHETLFDVLALSGVGFTKLGYETVTIDVPDPRWSAPDPESLAGLPPEAQTAAVTPPMVPVPIVSRCFWEHFSPKQALVPHDLRSTRFDEAPWLGYRFTLPLTAATRRKYQLPDDFRGSREPTAQHFDHGYGGERDPVLTGVELWYKSALYRDDIVHPQHLTHLVLIDGLDRPAIEEDSPDQALDPQGSLTADSLIGFPIHPLAIRTLTDTPWVPADCSLSRPLVNELNRSREQNLEFRDAATMKWMYNTDTLPAGAVDKIVRSPVGGMIGVPPEAFVGEGAIKELPQGSMPRENFAIADYIDADIARTWALDAGQQGVQSTNARTATAEQIQQANANARLDFERGIVLDWFCRGVTKFAVLKQRYLSRPEAEAVVGPQRAAAWDAWRQTAALPVAFRALPDSALRTDQAVDRKRAMDEYTYFARDPYVNRPYLLKQLARKMHLDPDQLLVQPEPPHPEPPKLALSFTGQDLVGPQGPIVIDILKSQGVPISDQALQQSGALAAQLAAQQAATHVLRSTAHGGKVAPMESLDKHQSQQTGGMQGVGGPAPMGPGGHV